MTRVSFLSMAAMMCLMAVRCFAGTVTEEYGLQERCGKRASEVFKEDNGNGIVNTTDGQSMSGFTNHYNKKQNKCFMLQTTTSYSYKDKSKKKSSSTLLVLFDVNDNKEYGKYFKADTDQKPFVCNVLDTVCHSEAEWDRLVKPYMEE